MSDNLIEKLRQQARLSKLDKENAKLKRLLAEACDSLNRIFIDAGKTLLNIHSEELQQWYKANKTLDGQQNDDKMD